MRRRLSAAARVVVCLAVTAMAVKGRWMPLPWGVVAAAGVVGSLAQVYWSRRPLVAAVVGSASYVLSGNPLPPLMGVTAGLVHGRRLVDRLAAATAGGAAWVGWSWIDEGRLTFTAVWNAAVGVALMAVVCRYAVTRRALVVSLRTQLDHAVLEREWSAERVREAERARIAREMHDVLAHKIALIALHAGALELRSEEPDRVRDGAGLIRRTSREALQELRDVLGLLRDDGADSYVRPGGVPELVREAEQAGLEVELWDTAGRLPAGTARVVRRVVQEGLTNAVKHAAGTSVGVRLDRSSTGDVEVCVENALVGGSQTLEGGGAGLIGLAERVRLVGGELTSGPEDGDDGRCWRLRARVPWLDGPHDEAEEGTRVDLRADRR